MGHNLWLHFGVDEHLFATFFDVHQGRLGRKKHFRKRTVQYGHGPKPRTPGEHPNPPYSHIIHSSLPAESPAFPYWPRPMTCKHGMGGQQKPENSMR